MSDKTTNTAASVPALEMIGVSVGSMRDFDRVVLRDVNWRVAEGDFWIIGGLQGAGKSDLLAAAAGLLPPLSGQYHVFGQALAPGYEQEQLHLRLNVGLVFETGRLLNHLSLADNVALPLRYHGRAGATEINEQVQTLLDLVGLREVGSQMPSVTGRNSQRRIGLARAMALRPRVLLVDNPLSGLDPREAAWWIEFLCELDAGHGWFQGQQLTLVVSSDQVRPWRNRAREFAFLRGERLIPLAERPSWPAEVEPLLKERLDMEGEMGGTV